MVDSLSILGQSDFFQDLTAVDFAALAVCLLGVVFLANWLVTLSGLRSLVDCPVRRNRLALFVPFIQIMVWLILSMASLGIIDTEMGESAGWQREFVSYMTVGVIETGLIILCGLIGHLMFARRLKGMGLDPRTLGRDFVAAVVNFISIFPLIMLSIALVLYLGRQLAGPSFQMDQSEGLMVIMENKQLSLRLLLIGFVIIVVPVFEEMLFRGMVQSVLRSVFGGPWSAIAVSSMIFAMMHPWTHWVPLFVLAMCMGYAYEKSGSLFRPIFIHAFFNTASVTAALIG